MNLKNYLILVHVFFILLFITKFINVVQDRIDLTVYLFWIVPILVFYRFIVKLNIKAFQWFCFVLLIYFLSSSLRVFGTSPYWLDVAELILICVLFIHIMYGPKKIKSMN
ncbi:MAG: DUF2069 domain-containing protein [Pseudomonadota bacterium]|nr:DUF2069 domain-containing protein [Pseudomonadota bacterium]